MEAEAWTIIGRVVAHVTLEAGSGGSCSPGGLSEPGCCLICSLYRLNLSVSVTLDTILERARGAGCGCTGEGDGGKTRAERSRGGGCGCMGRGWRCRDPG